MPGGHSGPTLAVLSGETMGPKQRKKRRRGKGKKMTKAQRRSRAVGRRLGKRASALRKRASKHPPRSLQRSVLSAQAKRMSTLHRIASKGRKVSRSPVYKAMHIKANPGLAGTMAAMKVLLPQAGVGAVSMVGLAYAGKYVDEMLVSKLPVPEAAKKYMPAVSTALLTAGAFMAANKFAPRFKGVVAIGGVIAAALQALAASGVAGGALSALGVGDYTMVGDGRGYADGGIFREIGDYTTVGEASEAREGGAYSTHRPRNYGDNRTEMAMNGLDDTTEFSRDSLRGLDDTTEFAPGEGGILSGGIFR
jgi:hypothetical protein